MDSGKNYIDKLYSEKFEEFEMKTASDDWAALSTKLARANFIKFSLATFNVYYLAAMVVLTATVVFFAVTNLNLNDKIENLENKINQSENPEVINFQEDPNVDSSSVGSIVSEAEMIDKALPQKEAKKNQDEIKNVGKNKILKAEETSKIEEKDTLASNVNPIIVETPDSIAIKASTTKIKRIKKTVFVKKEQVIVNDTVKINKK